MRTIWCEDIPDVGFLTFKTADVQLWKACCHSIQVEEIILTPNIHWYAFQHYRNLAFPRQIEGGQGELG